MHIAAVIVVCATAALIALPTTLTCIYLLALTCLSRQPEPPCRAGRNIRFDVIVPAHDEAAGISRTISSLQTLRWPQDQYRILVVADNCTDDTAEKSRRAGVMALERHDVARRGKGYALAYAFNWSRNDGFAQAVAVVDADTVVSANLLASFAARIEGGAGAMQAHYGVLNATESWRTRLMAIALGAIHKLRSRARDHLGLSCGIRGNGWCVTHAALADVPYRSFSLTEDVEFGIELGLAGYPVVYCDESDVYGEMVSTSEAARSQRQRWEGGRLALVKAMLPALLRTAVTRRSLICIDLALDLMVLPLSYIAIAVLIVLGTSMVSPGEVRPALVGIGLFDLLALCAYVGRGWMLSGIGPEGFLDLLRVPGFLVWKLVIIRFQPKSSSWIRTKRQS